MPRIRDLLVAMSMLGLYSCKFPLATDVSDLVTNLRFAPSAFDSFRENTEIRYSLEKSLRLSIYIVARDTTGQDRLVNTLFQNVVETKGSHSHTWLGDTNAGSFAPSGLYLGVVKVENRYLETVVRVFHF